MKDSLNTELLKLGLAILGVVTGIQAGVPHFRFRRLLGDGSSLSVSAHASLQLLSSHRLLLTQLGMVRFGQLV